MQVSLRESRYALTAGWADSAGVRDEVQTEWAYHGAASLKWNRSSACGSKPLYHAEKKFAMQRRKNTRTKIVWVLERVKKSF